MSAPTKSQDARRPKVQTSRSFSRPELLTSNPNSPTRTRANTVQTPIVAVPEARKLPFLSEEHGYAGKGRSDIFESSEEQVDKVDEDTGIASPDLRSPQTLEQLPIEIQSLTDRFLKSLSAKSHATPLKIDTIAELFQEFYIQAESHIGTHIDALTTRLSRSKSPTPSISSRISARIGSSTDYDDGSGEQQMLTASEITGKRKARRALEMKRVSMEEAVERGVCEKVYHKIYRHRSADDEERDAKLRSKTAALSLVGVGLKELHVDVQAAKDYTAEGEAAAEDKINKLLAPARESIEKMDDERYPLGKLQHLTAAHKSIVETLSEVFPSSSSADEVLPTLIYTLITSSPERLNVASNLHFVQLFRASHKIDGEAAYCLVNLEAAISFLETVDLSSLRADEAPEGPAKSVDGLGITTNDGNERLAPEPLSLAVGSSPISSSAVTSALPSPSDPISSMSADTPRTPDRPSHTHQRRLSTLIQAQADRIEAGRENFLKSADQAFDSINSTLENSLRFFSGRLKQQESEGHGSPVIIPKTLDDARKLVSSPLPEDEEPLTTSGRSSVAGDFDDPLTKPSDSRFLEIVGGRRNLRDHSADSTRSGGSGSNKRVAFANGDPHPHSAGPADAVGNFVNSLNPLSRFGVPSFAKFGRSASGPAPSTPPIGASRQLGDILEKDRGSSRQADGRVHAEVDLNAAETLAQLRKVKPPIKRFLEVRDAKELRIGEVEDLLRDYRRLAEVLREAVTS